MFAQGYKLKKVNEQIVCKHFSFPGWADGKMKMFSFSSKEKEVLWSLCDEKKGS